MEERSSQQLLGWKNFFDFLRSLYGILASIPAIFPLATGFRSWFPHAPGCKPIAVGLATISSLFVLLLAYNMRGVLYRLNRQARKGLLFPLTLPLIHALAILFFILGTAVAYEYVDQFFRFAGQWQFRGDELDTIFLFNAFFVLWTSAFVLEALEMYRREKRGLRKVGEED